MDFRARRCVGIEDVSQPQDEGGTEMDDKPRNTMPTSNVDASTCTPARAIAD
jgi:hypothetical protein